MFNGTFAGNVLNRRYVVYLGEKMIKLAVGGLQWDVIHENDPDYFVNREFVHNSFGSSGLRVRGIFYI